MSCKTRKATHIPARWLSRRTPRKVCHVRSLCLPHCRGLSYATRFRTKFVITLFLLHVCRYRNRTVEATFVAKFSISIHFVSFAERVHFPRATQSFPPKPAQRLALLFRSFVVAHRSLPLGMGLGCTSSLSKRCACQWVVYPRASDILDPGSHWFACRLVAILASI